MKSLTLLSLLSAGLMLVACGSTEEYEVTGEVSSAQTVSGAITLEFFEVDANDAAARESIKSVELSAVGAFTETIEASPDAKLVAVALVDADSDGACTEGELWDEADLVRKTDGTLEALALALTADPCPATQ
ncbi:MAG TPA: hypothetical protein VFB62_11905 [Polyangiaceae bacterium]|jgi:hypothetical protein|nr:hypothetical protein [Polyangiaceae bacterium]